MNKFLLLLISIFSVSGCETHPIYCVNARYVYPSGEIEIREACFEHKADTFTYIHNLPTKDLESITNWENYHPNGY